MFAVEVRDRIMIAHSLPDPFFGPASKLHGATFVVDVAFFRSELTRHNVVVDIGAALRVLNETLEPLGYQNLDELPQFDGKLTTTEFLCRYVFDRMGGKGKLVYLSGIDGAPASDQRDDGFYRALKDYPNIELLTQAFGFWDPARSQQTMADVLAAYPQIDGVVAQDGQCLATIRAFQAANREAPVINADGFRPMMEYWAENVDKGFTSFAIANGPGFAMTCSLGVGVRMLQGREIKPELLKGKVLNLDHTNIITDANVKEQLAEHTRLRGLEDYVDEIWSQEKLDSLFVE